MFYGLDWIATVPPTVRLTAQRFGPERANLVFGWIFAGHQLGAGAAALACVDLLVSMGLRSENVTLTDIGADPTVSIAIDESWIQWLLEQPIPLPSIRVAEALDDDRAQRGDGRR